MVLSKFIYIQAFNSHNKVPKCLDIIKNQSVCSLNTRYSEQVSNPKSGSKVNDR
ncbi:hypothetical protein Hanom_Chr09g00794181 [Helianthus anomalus]